LKIKYQKTNETNLLLSLYYFFIQISFAQITVDDPEIKMITEVKAESLENTVKKLFPLEPRHTLSDTKVKREALAQHNNG
jgi:hypothetical protein